MFPARPHSQAFAPVRLFWQGALPLVVGLLAVVGLFHTGPCVPKNDPPPYLHEITFAATPPYATQPSVGWDGSSLSINNLVNVPLGKTFNFTENGHPVAIYSSLDGTLIVSLPVLAVLEKGPRACRFLVHEPADMDERGQALLSACLRRCEALSETETLLCLEPDPSRIPAASDYPTPLVK